MERLETGKGSKRKHGQDADAAAGAAALQTPGDERQQQQQQQNITPAQHHLLVMQRRQRELEWAAHCTEQLRQQRLRDSLAAHAQRAEHVAEPSADAPEPIAKLLADLQRQQYYDDQQKHLQIAESVDAAFASFPLAATREIHYATKQLQDWYPWIGEIPGEGWYDLAAFLAQPTLVQYQKEAT